MLLRMPQSGGVVALARGSGPATQPRVPQGVAHLCDSVVEALQRGQVTPTKRHGRRSFQRIHSSKGKRKSYSRLLSWSACVVVGQGLLSMV